MNNPTGLIAFSGCDHANRICDVIFVHGLGGDARGTWHPQGKRDDDLWPMWLGKDLPDVGIWSFGYEAEPSAWKGKAMPLFDQASYLLDWLDNRDLGERPLIFVTHSLGGLLVKEMLRSAQNFTEKKEILNQTKGIVFLATPHTGANLANFIEKFGTLMRININVEELKAHAPQLRQLNEWYRENVNRLEIDTKVYYETQPMSGILVVNEDSANPGILGVKPVGLPYDHISIAKPESTDSPVYLGVRKFIKKKLTQAHPIELKSKEQSLEKVTIDKRKIGNYFERNATIYGSVAGRDFINNNE